MKFLTGGTMKKYFIIGIICEKCGDQTDFKISKPKVQEIKCPKCGILTPNWQINYSVRAKNEKEAQEILEEEM